MREAGRYLTEYLPLPSIVSWARRQVHFSTLFQPELTTVVSCNQCGGSAAMRPLCSQDLFRRLAMC
jgi:hypothetical protein